MTLHRARVRAQLPNLRIVLPNERFDYDGKPTWQFEPVDQAERAAWREQVSDPIYAENEIRLSEQAAASAALTPEAESAATKDPMSGQAPQGYVRTAADGDPLMAGQAPQRSA
ncbi:hypothetical protein AAG612_03070 [Citromicrobium bathyomarinum]|uniref:hypothetical protein n=1 Tax=Citromicrobium bathyomarinum TaxID=72174 RepID=UPI00315A4BC2